MISQRSVRRRLLVGTCSLAACAVLNAAPARAQDGDAATYQPYGEVVAHAGSDETGVSLEGWSPIIQGDTALLFIDGRTGITDDTDGYANIGLGVRAMLGDSVVVGGYGYFDYTRDEANRDFYGATFGAEVMTPRFELRANYYLPTTDDKYLGTEIDSTGTLTITGNELVERRDTMRFDLSAMQGVDAEVGVRLFGSEDGSNDFRLYGGGYHYWNDLIEDVDGGYGEAEYRLHGLFGEGSFVSLAGRVSDDNLRGTDVSGQLRLRLSFGKPRGGAAKLTGVESRMAERVRRRGPMLLQQRATPGTRDFGVLNAQTGQEFGQFFFVDGANTAGTGDPDDATTLGDAAGRAGVGDYIVAEGGSGNITTTGVTLADGASLVGGGGTTLQVRTENGGVVPFTLGTSAGTIANSNAAGNTLTLGDGNLVSGLSLIGGANAIVGDGITGTTIRNVTISGVAQSGIALTDVAAASITDSDVAGGAAGAIAIGGTGAVNLEGLALASNGGNVLSLDGTGGNLVIAKFADLTIAGGNGEIGGVLVTDAVFDANPATTGIDTVAGGDIAIGSATDRVGGGGLVLDGVLGAVAFGDVDVYTDGGDGLYVRDGEGKAGSFFFANDSGTIDAIGGAAVDIDPVTVDSTFDSLASAGSPGAGLIFDTVAGSFTVTGPTKVTNPAGDGIVIVNSTADFSFGATEITGFTGTGADLRGAQGDVRFASLDIEGDGSAGSKGIDMSGSTNAGFVGTTGPSTITGVETGVDLTGAQITGTFQFGDGSDTDGNGAASLIEAGTPIVATDLGVTGTYNFLDAELVGDISGLAGDEVTVFFVDSTAGIGTANDPGTIAQAEASGADIIILVNDGLGNLDSAGSGSDNTLLLAEGQRLTGFYGQDSLSYQQGGPQANLLVHGLAAGVEVTVDDPTGNGGVELVSTIGNALTLSGNTVVDHVQVGDSALAGVWIDGVSGSIAMSSSAIDSLGIDGGSSVVSLVGTQISSATNGALAVIGGHTGTLTMDATSSIASGALHNDYGILFYEADGTYNIGAQIQTLSAGGIAIDSSNGAFDFDGAITLQSTTRAALSLIGANGPISFGTVDITPGDVGIEITDATANVTFADVGIGASTTSEAAVAITAQASTSTITFDTLDLTRTINADANGFEITDSAGTITVTAGTFNKTGASTDLVNISGGSATITIGATLTDSSTGNGIEIDGITGGAVTFTGDYARTAGGDATLIGFDAANTGGAIVFDGDVTVDGGSNINIKDTYSIAFNGTTSVTFAVGSHVDVSGSNGTVSFADLDIDLATSNTVGLDLNGASFSGGFSAKDFDLTSALGANTIGVDLRGTEGTVRLGDTVANGGASASISGALTTGVRIDNTSDVTFTFGDGENTVDVASVINLTGSSTAVDFGDNDGTVGSFNFVDVDWTQATNAASYANLLSDFTIYYIDAEGDGDGSALNPGSFDDAGALAADVLIVVNQNPDDFDYIDLQASSQGSIGSFELQDGQGLFGFHGGETLNLAQYGYSMGGAPTNFQFTAIAGVGNQIENPGLGTGSPIIQGGPDTITVSEGAHSVIGGVWLQTLGNAAVSAGNARSLIIADSVLYGLLRGLSIEAPSSASIVTDRTFTIRNSEFSGSFSEGLYLLSPVGNNVTLDISGSLFMGGLTPGLYVGTTPGGEVTLALSDVTALSGTYGLELVNDNGGITITDFDQITVTEGRHGVRVAGGVVFDADTATSGWQTVEASSLTIGSAETPLLGAGLVLDNVLGALSIDDLQLHVQQGPALYIDGSANNIGDFTFIVGGGDIDATQVASDQDAVYLNYVTTDITLDSFTAKLGQNGVSLNHVAAGGEDGNALTIGTLTLDGMSGYGMLLQSVEGDVTVTDGAIGGTDDTGSSGVGIFGGAANFAIGADITKTSAGNIVDINGGDPESVTFSGALTATGGFDNGISVANLGSGAISFTGPVTLSTGGNTAIAISNNADAAIGFSGGLDIDTTTGTGINAGGSTLTVVDSASISNTITTTGGTALNFHTLTIGDDGMTFDSIDVTGGLNGLFFIGLGQTEESTGLAILDGSIESTQEGGYAAYILETSADIAIGADLSATSTGYHSLLVDGAGRADGLQAIVVSGAINDDANGIYLNNNDQNGGNATITLSGTIDIDTKSGAYEGFQFLNGGNLNVAGQMSVDTVGSTAGVVLSGNTDSTITFNSGGNGFDITTAVGTGLQFTGGGTLTVLGSGNTITTATGNLVDLQNGAFGDGGVTFASLTTTGTAALPFYANKMTGGTFDGGALTIAGASGLSAMQILESTADFAFDSITISATATNGIITNANSGDLTVTGKTSVAAGSYAGVRIEQNGGTVHLGETEITGVGAGVRGLAIGGTFGGPISIDDLDIALTGVGAIGVDMNNAVANGNVTITDFDLTSTSSSGTVGIVLNGMTGTGTVRFGDPSTPYGSGESATIAGVGTGVTISDASDINFIFGDGEGDVDIGSSISAVTAIDFTDATGANGTFNFLDVTFPTSGSITNLESSADVYWVDAAGDGDGSKSNPGNFAGAAGHDVIVLVNTNGTIQDIINLAAPSQGVSSYTLTDGQVLASFAASDTLNLADYGIDVGGAPSNLLLSNIASAAITNPYAGYAPQLISSADVTSAIVLADGSTTWIDGVLFGDSGDTQSAISGAAFASFTLTNSTIRSGGNGITLALGTNSSATNATATIKDSTIVSAGGALSFSSGNGDLLSINLDDVSAKSNGGRALFVGPAGTGSAIVAINDLTLEGATMSNISTNAMGTGDLTITAFADVTVLGTGLSINSLSGLYEITLDADLDTPGLQAINGGDLNIGTSGSPVSGYGLVLSNVSGRLNFGDINIYSSGNAALYVYNQTLETAQPALGLLLNSDGGTIWSENSRALELDSITLGMKLDSVSASGTGGGISIDEVAGSLNILGGAISTTAGTGALITNSTLYFTYGGTITNATTGRTVSVSNHTGGTITFSGAIDDNGFGINLQGNTGGLIDFTGEVALTTGDNDALTLIDNKGYTVRFNAGGNGLDIITTGGRGLAMTGGGTLNILGTNNSIATGAGTILDIEQNTLQGTVLDLNFATVANTLGETGIVIDRTGGGLIGSVSIGGGAITATDIGVSLTGTPLTFSYGGTITTSGTNALSVFVSRQSANTVTFSGNITDTSRGIRVINSTGGTINFTGQSISLSTTFHDALDLVGNTGATINFNPAAGGTGLDIITTTTGTGLLASGGTISVTGSGNSITTASGSAVHIDGATIGAAGITFESISKNGGTATGIYIKDAGTSGFFTVTGADGADLDTVPDAGSGGTIQNIGDGGDDNATAAGIGAYFENTGNISLNNMVIGNGTVIENYAIRGVGVTNFTLRDSTVSGTLGDAGNEAGIFFSNLTGVGLFEGNTVAGGFTDNMRIANTGGTLNLFVRDSANNAAVFGLNANGTGEDALDVAASNDATVLMLVDGVQFDGWRGYGVSAYTTQTANMDVTIRNNTFANAHANIDTLTGVGVFVAGSAGGNDWGVDYSIANNTFTGSKGPSIQAEFSGYGGTARGLISGNTIGTADGSATGVGGAYGILVGIQKHDNPGELVHLTTIQNNLIRDASQYGIYVRAVGGTNSPDTGVIEATITNNAITEMSIASIAPLGMVTSTTGSPIRVRAAINGNVLQAGGAQYPVWLQQVGSNAAFEFPSYIGTDGDMNPNNNFDIDAYFNGNNTLSLGTQSQPVRANGTTLDPGSLQPAQTGSNTDLPTGG